MKKMNKLFILLALAIVCLMPLRAQAAQLDDKIYNPLFNGAAPVNYNTGAVLIYRGWHTYLGYETEMIKAIPHMNIINLTGQTLQITTATGCFGGQNIVGQVALMRENTPTQIYAYSFDLTGINSEDTNTSPGPQGGGTAKGDASWVNGLQNKTSDLVMSVGNQSFGLHVDWGSRYNASEVGNADLVTMSLRDTNTNKYASYTVNNGVINRGMVYLTGYQDAYGQPYQVFLVAGDRINITFLVKYVNS
ncbi:MAG: hypothetical protein P4N41_14485 [Negativicutes bacterium]|nr:hypothetical protein [Negativicutes bacterium]